MELQDLLHTLQTLNTGQKLKKDSLAVKITKVLDVMVDDKKIKYSDGYYSKVNKANSVGQE